GRDENTKKRGNGEPPRPPNRRPHLLPFESNRLTRASGPPRDLRVVGGPTLPDALGPLPHPPHVLEVRGGRQHVGHRQLRVRGRRMQTPVVALAAREATCPGRRPARLVAELE